MKDTKNFESWKDVIIDFFEHRVEKINTKQNCKLYKARVDLKKMEKDISSESDARKLEKLKVKFKQSKSDFVTVREKAPITEIRQWIDETSEKSIDVGKRIIKATHALRFSHGSSVSEGHLLTGNTNKKEELLSTCSFKKELIIDMAHNNGNLITRSRFLALKLNQRLIFDLIFDGDFKFLSPFFKDIKQLEKWKKGLRELIECREIRNADKSKQVYFPTAHHNIPSKTRYHILAPLFSSSLAQELYDRQTALKYGKMEIEIRKLKNTQTTENKDSSNFHFNHSIELPNMAVQKFGGAQPQNISMLNKDRGGLSYLLSNQPPTWKGQLKPPVLKKSLFDGSFTSSRIQENISYLRNFLIRFKQIDISIQNPKRRRWVNKWVESIIDELFDYVSNIQSMPPGWSTNKDIKLKQSHQLFLDPYRDDDVFQQQRKSNEWQLDICGDFASWLNRRIIGKYKKFTPQIEHRRMWIQIMETPLREFNEITEIDSQHQRKEAL